MTTLTEAARAALEALDDATDAQSNPKRVNFPTIHDFGRWRRAADKLRAALAASEVQAEPVALPPAYMLAKLQMVMPIFQEARDALCALTEAQRKLRGISPTLADRMDEAGTFSLDDWQQAHPPAPEQPAPAIASAPRVPLTDEQVFDLIPTTGLLPRRDALWLARAIERAHGIAPQPEGDTP